ncbi:MAG: 1-acyl-sn-glycerol-3-phosphate acyltransferase [Corynebacteriales bacterium]|nr:1-acyl-sn-glycerol-3-phosphate acyltransferase [Mycobacteriales bacterium]
MKRGFWLRVAEAILRPILVIIARKSWQGQANMPAGGVIFAVNHISYADPLLIAHFVYDTPRNPRFLAKESLFRLPIAGYLLRKCGQIPVKRGAVDASHALDAAADAIRAGHAVIVYPEGTCTKEPEQWPMQGRTGIARLALTTGAPVVPIAQWGAQRIHHPLTNKIHLWRSPITISAGAPIDLRQYQGQPVSALLLREVTDVIMQRLRDDVAVLRNESAPTGPFFVPPARKAKK